jgi:septal ring factor EnvC (AmiA/AmiB activator)
MKNYLKLFLLSLVIVACGSSNQDIAKKNIEEHLLKQMNDAKSYEFVGLDSLNFYSKFDSIKIELELAEMEINGCKDKVNGLNELKTIEIKIANIKNTSTTYELEQVSKDIDENSKKITDLEKSIGEYKEQLKNQDLKKELVEYRTNIQFRGKNAMGALVLNSAYVRLNKDMKVIDFDIKESKTK